MAKVKKTISISEDCAAVLAKQDNASQYIEDLVLARKDPAPWANLEYKLDRLWVAVIDKPYEPPKPERTRSKSDIKREIDEAEAERKEELEYVQDADTIKDINSRYQSHIDALWAEFHESA